MVGKEKMRKEDFFSGCFDGSHLKKEEFVATFCNRCRNTECSRSKFGNFSWSERMATQLDSLFENIHFADQDDPKYKELLMTRFEEVLPEASTIQLQINNWEVPEDNAQEKKPSYFLEIENPLEETSSQYENQEASQESPKQSLISNEIPNTKVPVGGHYIGTQKSDSIPPKTILHTTSKKEVKDEWAVPKETIIPVGGTITIPKKFLPNS